MTKQERDKELLKRTGCIIGLSLMLFVLINIEHPLKWIFIAFYVLCLIVGISNLTEVYHRGCPKKIRQTKALFLDLLSKLHCNPYLDEDGVTIRFGYHGSELVLTSGYLCAQIIEPFWAHINVNHPEYSLFKEAVNATNYDFGLTILWTDSDENGEIGIHSKLDFILIPGSGTNITILQEQLNRFADAKFSLETKFKELIKEKHNKKNPIGFTTPSNN